MVDQHGYDLEDDDIQDDNKPFNLEVDGIKA